MAYGAPKSSDQAEPYLRRLLGREPTPEGIADLKRRYDLIGGGSPLNDIVQQQAEDLAKHIGLEVFPAFRFWGDTIQQAVDHARKDGAKRLVGLALTPFDSPRALGAYRHDFTVAAGSMPNAMCGPWPTESHWTEYWSAHIPKGCTALFTAHSLPVAGSEEYVAGIKACAEEISLLSGVEPRIAFQSRPPSPGAWLGPTIEEILPSLPKGRVLVAPIGFVCDHLEILYDLDILHRKQAEDLGLIWTRLPMPNAEPILIKSLAATVAHTLRHVGWLA